MDKTRNRMYSYVNRKRIEWQQRSIKGQSKFNFYAEKIHNSAIKNFSTEKIETF